MGDVRYIYEQANGMWWEYRYRSIGETVGNILLNYILGKLFGVYGIIVATIITIFFVNYLYGAKIIFKSYFKSENIVQYFTRGLYYAVTATVAAAITYLITINIPFSILGFICRLLICLLIPNIILYLLLFKTTEYSEAIPWLLVRIKKT